MKKRNLLLTSGILAFCAAIGHAQTPYRHATLVNTGNPSQGRCTVSVLLDGSADVEIRGDNAQLRPLAGSQPQWQRFECTGPLPSAGTDLQLRALEGNGKMTLTHDSDAGGVAVVRIDNLDNQDQLFTFDVFWRWPERAYTSSDADRMVLEDDSVEACQNAVESRIRGDGYRNVHFSGTSRDDNGVNDWVTGTATANRTYGSRTFTFSCRVDSSSGQVRRLDVRHD